MSSNNSFTKRLIYEVKLYESQKEYFNEAGIYFEYNSDNLTSVKLLIIGPENTPYENGFYFFNINIPATYPFSPPKITFLNKIDNIRFHPNLYVEGYVCLSVLNTWGNNEWSPCQNLTSIASTIQSVMNENPITNEPEYENETGQISQEYYKIIEYYNLKSIYKNIINPIIGYDNFLPIIKKYFLSKYETYLEIIEKNKKNNNQIVSCSIYGLSVKLDYKKLKSDFKILHLSIEGRVDLQQH
jgi:ubiquitin-protein ligase